MIFVRDKGRMCNNILQYGHVYAWGREHGMKCVSMRFAYKYNQFNICHTPYHNFLVYAMAKYAARFGILPVAGFHDKEDNDEAMKILEGHKWLVVEGWEVRFYDLFLKYKTEILGLFAFDNKVLHKVKGMMENVRHSKDSIKLGVHVRRGDYKTWNGGKYYYSDEQINEVVQRFSSLHPDSHIDVFVCGNDPHISMIKQTVKGDRLHVHVPEGTQVEDLCMMSECDYIIGAPSTYSLVASMYHDTPLNWIYSPSDELSFDHFDNLFRKIL